MTPFWTTAILSQCLIVVSRCATVTDVKERHGKEWRDADGKTHQND